MHNCQHSPTVNSLELQLNWTCQNGSRFNQGYMQSNEGIMQLHWSNWAARGGRYSPVLGAWELARVTGSRPVRTTQCGLVAGEMPVHLLGTAVSAPEQGTESLTNCHRYLTARLTCLNISSSFIYFGQQTVKTYGQHTVQSANNSEHLTLHNEPKKYRFIIFVLLYCLYSIINYFVDIVNNYLSY